MRLWFRHLNMLRILPEHSMFDQKVTILAEGLEPFQDVTVSAKVDHPSGKFGSEAHFISNISGGVNLGTNSSRGGTYTGVHPMGLFWSLKQLPNQRPGVRLTPREVQQPMTMELSIRKGHMSPFSPEKELEKPIFSTKIHRYFVHPMVESFPVREGRIRGVLYRPKGVIDMFGTAGGLMQHRAALLASHGFVALSLAFFDYEDLPDRPSDVQIEYFQEAAEWLARSEGVLKGGVGIIGTSLGADCVSLACVVSPHIKAAVWINGAHALDAWNPFTFQGKPWPTEQGDMSTLEIKDGVLVYRSYKESIPVDHSIVFPIETSKAKRFLFLACEDDKNLPAVKSAKILTDRLRKAGKDNFDLVIYPWSGHLLEPPYIPHCSLSYHKVVGGLMTWGGEAEWHNQAQEDSWKRILEFLTQNVGEPAEIPDLNSVLTKSRI